MGRFHRGLGSRWSSGGASLSLLLVGCVSLLACGDGGVSRRPSGYDGFLQVVDAGGRRDTGVRADQFIPPSDSAPPARDSQPPAVDSTAQNTTVVLVITGMT